MHQDSDDKRDAEISWLAGIRYRYQRVKQFVVDACRVVYRAVHTLLSFVFKRMAISLVALSVVLHLLSAWHPAFVSLRVAALGLISAALVWYVGQKGWLKPYRILRLAGGALLFLVLPREWLAAAVSLLLCWLWYWDSKSSNEKIKNASGP